MGSNRGLPIYDACLLEQYLNVFYEIFHRHEKYMNCGIRLLSL